MDAILQYSIYTIVNLILYLNCIILYLALSTKLTKMNEIPTGKLQFYTH
jgi:hypothetical protein